MSAEFRNVHAARECLEVYQQDRCPEVIHLSLSEEKDTHAFGIYETVFLGAGEVDAYREIQIAKLNMMFSKYGTEQLVVETSACIAVHMMEQTIESIEKLGLTPKEIAEIYVDWFGDQGRDALLKNAEESVERRREIVGKYKDPDNDWVGYAETALQEVKSLT